MARRSFSIPVPSSQSVGTNSRMPTYFCSRRAPVEIEGVLLDLVQHHDHRRVAAEALDQSQPVVGVRVLATLAAFQYQEIKAALGEEELVGGVHGLLPAEVPHVQPHLLAVEIQRPVR